MTDSCCLHCRRPLRRNLLHRGGLCGACHREQRAAALFGAALVMCRHCGQRPPNRPRQLCWPCYKEPAIRALYPAFAHQHSHAAPKLDKLPLLPVLEHYPDHTRLPRCPHGLVDGLCAACEQEQRAGLVFSEDQSP